MTITMHGITTIYSNIKTDIRIASESGYDALEILESKILRYLDCGFEVQELMPLFEKYNILPVCINALKDIDHYIFKEKRELVSETERLCAISELIKCPTIQLNLSSRLEGKP